MTLTKQIIIFLFLFVSFSKVSGQVAPPPAAMPTKSNTILIDKIIQVTNHEKYFTDYCSKKILAYAKENNLTQKKTDELLRSAKFEYYNSAIYNSYAFYSTSQLNKLLDILTDLSKTVRPSQMFILTNEMMQSNLDSFVKTVVEGKYVMKGQ
jgi:hypothetical protein